MSGSPRTAGDHYRRVRGLEARGLKMATCGLTCCVQPEAETTTRDSVTVNAGVAALIFKVLYKCNV